MIFFCLIISYYSVLVFKFCNTLFSFSFSSDGPVLYAIYGFYGGLDFSFKEESIT